MNTIPTYLINGFLDSGKSEFISYTLNAPYFKIEGTTLLILCEEGEIEYDNKLIKDNNVAVKFIEDQSDFSLENLVAAEKEYKPERIIIEWNGMWNFKELELPPNWITEQQITNIDGSTFPMYFNNMRSLLSEMIRGSDMIIFNRCDGLDEELAVYKRNVKAVNQNADIIFEDKDGEISTIFEDDLPYDLTGDSIELTDDTYGIWYIDSLDHAERYKDKKITFTGMVMKPPALKNGCFVPGRMVMTCCADDISFLGFVCKYDKASELKDMDWVKATVTMGWGYHKAYGSEGPILEAISVEKTKAPENTTIGI